MRSSASAQLTDLVVALGREGDVRAGLDVSGSAQEPPERMR